MRLFRCPRCHRGRLYAGVLRVAPACGDCGLSFGGHEQGDGPAFFGILVIGALAAIGATVVDLKYAPPLWVHAAVWVPFIVLGSIASLRLGKAALIHWQYGVKPWEFG